MTSIKTLAELAPWAAPGVKAYILTNRSYGVPTLTTVMVRSVTKARINLENGRSFYVTKHGSELKEWGKAYWDSPYLVAEDNPAVARAQEQIKQAGIITSARTAAAAFNTRYTVENAHKAVAALLDYIEAHKEG